MSNRILIGSCPKCQGALKEQSEEGEWACMNCGKLFLPPISNLSSRTRKLKPPILPGERIKDTQEDSGKKTILDTLNQDPNLNPEEQADEAEWRRLNPLRHA